MIIEYIISIDRNFSVFAETETDAKRMGTVFYLEDEFYENKPEEFYKYLKLFYEDYKCNTEMFLKNMFNKELFIWKAH